MQSYVALYKNKRIEVEASSSFEAQQAAAKLFNAKIYHVQIVPVDELAMLRQCDQLSSPVTKQDVSGPVDARGKRFKLGQKVARAAKNFIGNGLHVEVVKVTKLQDGKVWLNGSSKALRHPERVAILGRK